MEAILMCRVSDPKQEDKYSLDAQEREGREWRRWRWRHPVRGLRDAYRAGSLFEWREISFRRHQHVLVADLRGKRPLVQLWWGAHTHSRGDRQRHGPCPDHGDDRGAHPRSTQRWLPAL